MTGFPPNTPMFRMKINEVLLEQYAPEQSVLTKMQTALSKFERSVMDEISMSSDRAAIFELIKHLIVAGNVLVHDSPLGLRVYHLNHYVVVRDPSGNALEIIAQETIDKRILPDELRDEINQEKSNKDKRTATLFTRIERQETKWTVYQEVSGRKVPGTEGSYPLEFLPWLTLRMTRVDGEDYGRSYVEEYLGDLVSLETLTKSLVDGAVAAAKLLFMVNPNGTTQQKDIENADNGAVIPGMADEVTTLQAQKFHDFSTAEKQARVLESRLERAFLLNSAVQRDAERVTAEEIRFMAQELETTLGGFYTLFAQEFQLPYVRLKINSMQKSRKLPQLPKGVVKPTIITGVEALGRGNDRTKLVNYGLTLKQTFGEQGAMTMINRSEFAERLAAADGIDTKGLVPTQEELQQQEAQQQQQAMIASLGPQAINAGGKLLSEQMKGQTQAQPTGEA
jgi:hypothetical protein